MTPFASRDPRPEVQLGHLQQPQHAKGADDAAEAEEREVALVVLDEGMKIQKTWRFHGFRHMKDDSFGFYWR